MADYIEINIRSLNTDLGELIEELEKIRTEMKQMFDEIQALDTMWDGPANSAFNAQFASDYQLMEEMCTTIDSLIAYGDNARAEYISCENAVSAAIDEIKI